MGRRELIAAFARDRYRTVKLSGRMLIMHLDGRHVRLPPAHSQERMVMRVLEARGILQYVDDGAASQITEVGRWALAEILADMAELLVLSSETAAEPAPQVIEITPELPPHISTEMS